MQTKNIDACYLRLGIVGSLDMRWLEIGHTLALIEAFGRPACALHRKSMRGLLLLFFSVGVLMCFQAHGFGNLVLTWQPSSDPAAVGYNIYYGGSNGNYTNMVSVGNVTKATISGLTEGATYYFAATTCDQTGSQSSFSNQTSYTVPLPAQLALHPAPSNGTFTAFSVISTGFISDQWTLQSSPDLMNWTTIAMGSNSTVNVPIFNGGAPSAFFRLLTQ